jgi:4-amino-4-deoxy-L-arabinose transferase-like glycosyltransferase
VLVGALLVRLVFFTGLLGWDDIEYREAASGLLRGDFLPRSMFWLRYGLIVPLAAAQACFGQNEYSAALVPLTYSLASLVLTYALGVLYGGVPLGLAASTFLAILPLDAIAATDVHADLPASFWMAFTVYCVKRGEDADSSEDSWFLAGGLALGIAYLTKEPALAIAVVLLLRLFWLRRPWTNYGWLTAGFLLVLGLEFSWLGWISGNPLYRYSAVITDPHFSHLTLITPRSSWWMLDFPSMLLYPLSGYFGYFAASFYLVLAGLAWGIRRRDRAIIELTLWWLPLLLLLNFAPADPGFTRPLFFHFPRTLHPVLIPFALTAASWLLYGLGSWQRLRVGILLGVMALSALGLWTTHFDYRIWAWAARRVTPVIRQYPLQTLVAADPTTMWLLRSLLPERRKSIIQYADLPEPIGGAAVLILKDPLFLSTDNLARYAIPAAVLSPPPSWEKLAEFTRPRRHSLRRLLLEGIGVGTGRAGPTLTGSGLESVTLWRIPSTPRQKPDR